MAGGEISTAEWETVIEYTDGRPPEHGEPILGRGPDGWPSVRQARRAKQWARGRPAQRRQPYRLILRCDELRVTISYITEDGQWFEVESF